MCIGADGYTNSKDIDINEQKQRCSDNFLFKQNNSLAGRQAFAHCCELPQVWEKMFSLQYRKAKTVWGNVYVYNFIIVRNFVLADVMPICVIICQLWYAICHVSDTVHIVVKADVTAFDYMADVIAIFLYHIIAYRAECFSHTVLAFLYCKENIFSQTWGSSQQWAKACLPAKEIILFKEKIITTLYQTEWETSITRNKDVCQTMVYISDHRWGKTNMAAKCRICTTVALTLHRHLKKLNDWKTRNY